MGATNAMLAINHEHIRAIDIDEGIFLREESAQGDMKRSVEVTTRPFRVLPDIDQSYRYASLP